MKYVLLSFFLCITSALFAQDIITQKNGETIEVKIIELADDFVKFYHFKDPNKVEIVMNRSLIREIEFEYGRKEKEVEPGLDESYFVDDKHRNIKVNFLGLALGSTILTYEQAIDPKSSWEVVGKIHGAGVGYEAIGKSGLGIEANYKVKFGSLFNRNSYRPSHILEGVFLRPGIGYSQYTIKNDEERYGDELGDYSYFHGGLDIGKQWILNNQLSLELFGGLHLWGGDFDKSEDNTCESCTYYYVADGNMAGNSGENGSAAGRFGIQVGYVFK